jgi:ATP-binding cassette subfamily B (MDR/TAP) protein 1
MQVAPHMVTFSRAATAASELFALIDRQSETSPFDQSGDKPDETAGIIDLHSINFKYPTRPDVTVLEDFTLHIPAGKITALVVSRYPVVSFVEVSKLSEIKGTIRLREKHNHRPARAVV